MARNSCSLGVTLSGWVLRGILCLRTLAISFGVKGSNRWVGTWQGLANVTIASQIVVAFEWHKKYEWPCLNGHF